MSEKLKKLIDYEVIMPAIMIIFALSYFINVSDNPRTGRLFPQIICIIMLLLLVRIIIVNIKSKLISETGSVEVTGVEETVKSKKFTERKGLVLFTFIVMMFLYYLAILLVGYIYATFIFVVTSMLVLGYKNKKVILLVTVIFLLVIYVFFVLGFHFVLPQGSLIKGL
ncbi:MAG: hypothetical protein CVU87_05415 [Firmicutes bacterium HGW-Firmicutes-12]|nr:MAG: hypothetical protein CVU87_05415 [Firmicutes bacterium HGW-Firmicutes-12]